MHPFTKVANARRAQRAPLPGRRQCSRRHSPGLELLEDRVTPSVTSVFELDGNVTTTTTHDWDQVFADNNHEFKVTQKLDFKADPIDVARAGARLDDALALMDEVGWD